MFSAFGAAAQTSSPVTNPFAPKPKANVEHAFGSVGASDSSGTKLNKRKGRTSEVGDGDAQRKAPRALANKDSDASDGGRPKGRRGEDRGRGGGHRKQIAPNGDARPRKQRNAPRGNGAPLHTRTDQSRSTSPSSASSGDIESTQAMFTPTDTSDPHARNVYNQLRKDGISPPSWPSRPGDPSNSAAMSKFREKYENYRAEVRKSLTKAGLIDDPNKRRALKDAIEFKGICQDMCPEFEKITRITELDVHQPEKDPKTGHGMPSRMVKKLARSAAGQEAPLPMDVRSVPTLRRTLDYLIDDLLQHDGNLPNYHGFLWDRTRAIRRDFTFFSSLTPEEIKTQVYVLENIARFHVTALHLLSRKNNRPEEFVEQQELEQLGKTLLSLRDVYDDCNAQGIACENEPEFRAYYLIFHAKDSSILETLQRSWKPDLWRNSDEVRTAVSLVESLQNTRDFHGPLKDAPSLAASGAHHTYLRIVEDASMSYTMACFAECHFPTVRRSILRSIARALGRPKEDVKDVTAATLNKFLRFDTVDEAIEFAELHDLEFEDDPDDPLDSAKRRLVLRHRQQLPHIRLSHQFSQSMVEKKRGSHRLPEVVHRTVHQDGSSVDANESPAEGSLFVPDSEPEAPKQLAAVIQPQNSTQSPFSLSGKLSGDPNSSAFTPGGVSAPPAFPAQQNPLGSLSSQTPAATNPFAPAAKPINEKPSQSPFGTPSQPPPTLGFGGLGSLAAPAQEKERADETKPDTIKPNPFAGIQPKTDSSTLGTGGQGLTAAGSQPSLSPTRADSSDADKGKTPAFQFPSPTTQPQPVTAPPAVAAEKPTQPRPSPSNFPGFSSTSATSPLPTSQAPSGKTDNLPPPKSLSPSPFPQSSLGDQQKVPGAAIAGPGQTSGASAPAATPLPSGFPTTSSTDMPPPPVPRQDPMKGFTRWYVNGDHGLMEDFEVFMVDEILKKVYDQWVEEEEEKKRLEEEERTNAEVEAFRVYNLRVKFFYRWKRNARTKRLRFLRKSGREQFRAYHAAKLEEKREAARKAAEEEARRSVVNHSKEMTDLVNRKRVRRSQEEQELIASGVLSGVGNEREHAAWIVSRERQPSRSRAATNDSSRPSSSASTRRPGGKTQAIREQLLQKPQEGFRRSMPPMLSRSTVSPSSSRTTSRVSERWRLKAMGIIQMPDGTALPENMANEILYGGRSYSSMKARPRAASYSTTQRQAPTSTSRPERQSHLSRSYGADDAPATNKRKRSEGQDVEELEQAVVDGDASPSKRAMSDNQKIINELRAMREELEEGAAWYKSQSERLQSEVRSSRGTTPWDDGI